jgi:hypothetical protein
MAYRNLGRNIFCEVLNCDLINVSGSSSTGTGSAGQELDPVLGWHDAIGFSVFKTGNQTIPNNAATALAGWTATGAEFRVASASINTTTGVWTCPRTGVWLLYLWVAIDPNATGQRYVALQTGGSSLSQSMLIANASFSALGETTLLTRIASGTQITPVVYQNSGGGLDVPTSQARFSAIYLGASATSTSPL